MFNEDEYEDIKDLRYLFNEYEGKTYKEAPFKSIIVDIRNKLSKNGDKLIKKGLYYVKEMKKLPKSQVKNSKEKLTKFENELIRKNRLNNKIRKDLDDYNGDTKYKGIKDIRYLLNEEYIYNSIDNIKYLFNKNKDYEELKITHKESIIEDIKNHI